MRLNGNFELRGIEKKTSAKGNEYLVFHLEDSSGVPCSPIAKCPYDVNGLSKGDNLDVTFNCEFGKYPKCEVVSHKKVGK